MSKGNPLRLRLAMPPRGGVISLRGADLHHLRVRRLGVGDAILCFDDSGVEYAGVVRALAPEAAEIEISHVSQPQREASLRLRLAQAVLKGDHLDFVVEKATELGVAEVVLFTSERTVARPSPARVERLRRIAASAAKQSGRLRVPEVRDPLSFAEVLAPPAVVFQPGSEQPLSRALGNFDGGLTAIVGPEGGLSPVELARAVAEGCHLAGLGPRILRAETAAVLACGLCQFLWGDLGR